ncbi:putative gluconate transport associated protein [Wigglesworthia glossinidia endosymbiont of Glossina morsitans morsitans (Yale colony)]|uniref:Fe/S biogenesis protein NfuA n=1 Tax=Wigglesworthia glossinidia endosymbiont of Glossina morsitans morsitans (Yale colony) TaxID=1142511 RepID=H6Q516_WIGGL|nr:NifU family protein [Wigglesworthia glossinidia]AFA41299.1 putative gluconate transport associated protein [Wigglesworthia glossinidia endosymbiont of Glossina morsitans morsitans (Yale colony)]
MIYITKKAQKYISKLLCNQPKKTHIKLLILSPNTENIKCQVEYYIPQVQFSDKEKKFKFSNFNVYINKANIMTINYIRIRLKENNLNKQIIVNISTSKLNLKQKLSAFIQSKINTFLMQHKGYVELIDVTEDMFVLIKFFGGCNGCAMANITLQEGIEKEIKKFFPEIKGVQDITQHVRNNSSYY